MEGIELNKIYQDVKSVPSGIHKYKGMIDEIHKEIELLEGNLLPIRNQVLQSEKNTEGSEVELLGELNGIIKRLRFLNEEIKF